MFIPFMDNDAAHHANIALRMHLSGDYVNLYDHNGDYLDKPHLHFWLAAFSFKVFGVTSAYKLPSFLFSILGIYSTYKIGSRLYDRETGKLAALVIATAFAFILSNSDVRMDAILTSCIVFSSWQLVEFVQEKRMSNVLLSGLGLALGFATKGHIAVVVPLVTVLFYVLYRKDYKILIHWKWLLILVFFFVSHHSGTILLLSTIQPASGEDGPGQRSYQWSPVYFTRPGDRPDGRQNGGKDKSGPLCFFFTLFYPPSPPGACSLMLR